MRSKRKFNPDELTKLLIDLSTRVQKLEQEDEKAMQAFPYLNDYLKTVYGLEDWKQAVNWLSQRNVLFQLSDIQVLDRILSRQPEYVV